MRDLQCLQIYNNLHHDEEEDLGMMMMLPIGKTIPMVEAIWKVEQATSEIPEEP